MSDAAEIKVRLGPELKQQFDKLCIESGRSKTAQFGHMILATMAEPEDETGDMQDAAAPVQFLDHVGDQLEQLARQLDALAADRPQRWFEQWHKAQAAPAIADLAKRQSEHGQAHATANAAIAAIQTRLEEVARNTRQVQPRFYRDHRFWTAFAGGFLALVLILALLPGESAPSRAIARKIVGGKNDLHAANIMAGGNSFSGNLMQQTRALMRAEPFASDYARCIERATNARKVTRCTLTFPSINAR